MLKMNLTTDNSVTQDRTEVVIRTYDNKQKLTIEGERVFKKREKNN